LLISAAVATVPPGRAGQIAGAFAGRVVVKMLAVVASLALFKAGMELLLAHELLQAMPAGRPGAQP